MLEPLGFGVNLNVVLEPLGFGVNLNVVLGLRVKMHEPFGVRQKFHVPPGGGLISSSD
jgi:hypothetical protein